ncbi:MAG: sugar phosphate isomerase/epimerase [Candidatus Dormibacteraeota bacterium]|nr:sugar phosphate isomerase/epimerase [Candidatus Dormibacteraeota bacterium]
MRLAATLESFATVVKSGEQDVPSCIRACAAMGVGAMELVDRLIQGTDLKVLHSALVATGCHVCCYTVHCDITNVDAEARERELASLLHAVKRAAALGVAIVAVIPSGDQRAGTSDQLRRWYSSALARARPLARRLGVRLAVENIGAGSTSSYCSTPDDVNAIVELAGSEVATIFDVGNYVLVGEDPVSALSALRTEIVNVHLKDWRIVTNEDCVGMGRFLGRDGRCHMAVPLGAGIVDLTRAIRALTSRRDYRGFVTMDYEGPDSPMDAIPEGVGYLRALVAA